MAGERSGKSQPKLALFIGIAVATIHPVLGFASPRGAPPYSVIVSVAEQRTYVYERERLIRSMICSTGIPGTGDATPLGDFILNESGDKRGEWFYSGRYHEGARYWVGFIGGTYLFRSVPMDEDKRVIRAEAARLGRPVSHGSIWLGVEDAYWFYTTVPDGTPLSITARFDPSIIPVLGEKTPPRDKAEVAAWLAVHMRAYRQAYTLSCEIALMRVSLGLMGVMDVSENDILATIPRSGSDPEHDFVCDDLQGGRRNADGSINWNNYGTHPPVVVAELSRRMAERDLSSRYAVRELRADDALLRSLVVNDPHFLGAIVWLVGHPERWGNHPPVNERGMVLGEHVRFLEPHLAANGDFHLWDPETGALVVSREAGAARELFSYRIVGIFRKE
jgi:hypothetical protein